MADSKHPPEHPRFAAQADGLTEADRERGETGRLPTGPERGVRLEDSSIVWRAFQAVIENPENAKELTSSFVRLMVSTDPNLLATYADAERRKFGMWIGAALAILSIGGGVAILGLGGPLPIGVGLLSVGAACAGGTFAVITGQKVGLPEFREMLQGERRESMNTSRERMEN